MAGPVQPVVFPVMWARDASGSFLRTPAEMRSLIEAAGFRARAWDDVTAETSGPPDATAIPAYGVQRLIMGERLDEIIRMGHRNRDERRGVGAGGVRAALTSRPALELLNLRLLGGSHSAVAGAGQG
jgi:hypothetical protein